jgi:hypothetical protein
MTNKTIEEDRTMKIIISRNKAGRTEGNEEKDEP